VGAAEGFIFLSALFTGRIYFRMAEHDGYPTMTLKLWGRTLRLYGYHVLLLAFAFLVAVPIASHGDRPGLHNLLDFYFTAGAKQAVTEAALLIYRPPLLDILPMYIIFLMFTSVAIPTARRIGWKPILWTAFASWGLAQFGFRSAEHTLMMRYIPTRIPLNEMGSFDLWAWQFLWFIGVWLGVRWAQGTLPIETWARRAAIPAIRPLVLLGQSSLQVFCVHLLFCLAGLTLLGNASMLSGWKQFALLTVTFTAMLITAKMFSKNETRNERPDKAADGNTVNTVLADLR
jgi:hypothetical protein